MLRNDKVSGVHFLRLRRLPSTGDVKLGDGSDTKKTKEIPRFCRFQTG
jgi:hypothetical protein